MSRGLAKSSRRLAPFLDPHGAESSGSFAGSSSPTIPERRRCDSLMSFSVALRNLWDFLSISFHLAHLGSFAAASVMLLVIRLLDACQNMMAKQSPIVATTQEAIAQYSTLMRSGLGAGCPRLYGFRSGCFSIFLRSLAPELCDLGTDAGRKVPTVTVNAPARLVSSVSSRSRISCLFGSLGPWTFTRSRKRDLGISARAISRRGRIWHLSNRSSHPTSQPRALRRRRAAILASTRSRREKDEPRNEQRCRNKQPRRQDPTAATQHGERREPAVEAWQLREQGVFRWVKRRERSESRKPRPRRRGRPRAHPGFPIGHGPSDEPSSDSRLERVASRTRGSPAHGFPRQTKEISHGRLAFISEIFKIKGTIVLKVVPQIILTAFVGLFANLVKVLYCGEGVASNDECDVTFNMDGHLGVSVVLSFLLVFRADLAYERYYRGKSALGAIHTGIRNLNVATATFLRAHPPMSKHGGKKSVINQRKWAAKNAMRATACA